MDLLSERPHRRADQRYLGSGEDLLLFAHEVGQFCAQHSIPVAARGSATASLVVWALGLGDVCPFDYELLSSPGAIENVMMRPPELGIADAGAGVEPYNTLVRVAGRLEGLPHRYGSTLPPTRFRSMVPAPWTGCRHNG